MNAMSTIVNSTASGALAEAGTLATGDIWQIIIFFLAFSLLVSIIGLIYGIVKKKG